MTYHAGQSVRVADREHEGHHRTPTYLKGRTGSIERVHQSFANPETRAYGEDGLPNEPLYLVGFTRHDLWPEYRGAEGDRLYVDVFEHWLEVAT
jgi:nitrile hydratase subunit beta